MSDEGYTDRREIVEQLVLARSMAIATVPADDDEPPGSSPLWAMGITRVMAGATLERDPHSRRDRVVLVGAHVLGWIEAIDRELAESG